MIDVRLAGPESEPPAAATLLFGGDVYVAPDAPLPAIGAPVRRLISEAAAAVINLEAPLVATEAPIAKAGPHLRMSPSVADELRAVGFDVCSLANNHVMDHGWQGVEATERACAEAALRPVGVGASRADAHAPCVIDLGAGGRVALFAACESEFGTATDTTPGTAPISDPALRAAIGEAARTAVVVVLAHGGNEVVPVPSTQRREQLRAIVDCGASLVIGHHPHVAQGWEIHGEGAIFYSLGDLLFGDEAAPGSRERWSYLVRVGLDAGAVRWVRIAPVERSGDGLREIAADDPRRHELEELSAIAGSPDLEAYWQEVAVMLHEERYQPFLRQALGVNDVAAAPTAVQRALSALPRRRAMPVPDESAEASARAWREALLLVLLRCESHRWAMETASGVLSGDVPDRRTPAISRRVRELMTLGAV